MQDGNEASKGALIGKRPGPEKGLADVVDELLEIAEQALREGLVGVVSNMAVNVKEKQHVPTAKSLVDLVERLRAMKRLPREQHESFASVLWVEYQRMENDELEKS
jgi:hypothetical protein